MNVTRALGPDPRTCWLSEPRTERSGVSDRTPAHSAALRARLGRSTNRLLDGLGIVLTAWVLGASGWAGAAETRALEVHLAQASNDSPYAFVRAKFEPGEVTDPWAVRFFDNKDTEIPYFVWDTITWRVAHEGRADWGHRYALINHASGDTADVREARTRKRQATREKLPELAAKLESQEQAAQKAPDSVCAVLYLLRYRVPALGKE